VCVCVRVCVGGESSVGRAHRAVLRDIYFQLF
jgi:hypothetical protein